MSIDNSMFAEYLSNISENIKRSGSDIEFGFENLCDKLSDTNDFLEKISEEMLISNLPVELRNDQRKMFELTKSNKSMMRLIERFKSFIEKNPNDVGVESWKENVAEWTIIHQKNSKTIIELQNKGCVR